MLKKRIIYALIASSTLYFTVNSAYALPVTDGTINFTGKVVDASCTVAGGSVYALNTPADLVYLTHARR